MSSPYMQWAKSQAHAKYNLGTSGIINYPLSGLHVSLDDLEITGNSYYGYPPLLEALAQHCSVTTDRIFTTLGTSMANHLAMAVLLDPGDEILIEEPTYELLLSTAGYLGLTIKRFPRRAEQQFQVDLDTLAHAITPKTKLIVITNLHNPTGAYTDEATLTQIGKIARVSDAKVLVDEVYLPAAYDIGPRSSVNLGNEFIVTNSLTKVYGLSGLRCGWILAGAEIIKRLWLLNDLFNVNHSHPSELLSVIALQNIDQILNRTKLILESNRTILNQFLDSRDDLETSRMKFGTTVFPRLLKGNVDAFCTLLHDRYETLVVPGRFFEMPHHIRIGLGIEQEEFREGIVRIAAALDKIKK